ncbi:hypothetical protein SpCBS45565_g04224 [Spizellomyces sp. 'palustris']|nr:hypothetical protein SpCBS45565_g04224 [Spizellomyces sp. 'palustris']
MPSLVQASFPTHTAPSAHPNYTGLRRSQAVWDLPSVPLDTELSVNVTIAFPAAQRLPLSIESMSTVHTLKARIADLRGLDEAGVQRIKLTFNDREMVESDHIYEYGIGSGAILVVGWVDPQLQRVDSGKEDLMK